ncbi:zinc finger protein 830 [Aplysia californica]|uniref:Zinc finger protein 830 n=1 Tax=Aplysia californica TaxID=6500 RepID=A0ABM1VQJ6_APLCA|nr:zinc finger protein 830 [Aplysia californica]
MTSCGLHTFRRAIALKTQGPAKPAHLEATSVKRKADAVGGVDPKRKKTDFFDPGEEPSGSEEKPESQQNKKMSEILPEGFFDDPKMDAKVRKVEYKDKMEEEWDLFQRAMKEEAHVSEVIMEEEDEQANLDRNIDEIDDQIHRWQEVENLHVKKETILKTTTKEGQKDEDSGDDLEEEDLDQFLEWRAKKVMK